MVAFGGRFITANKTIALASESLTTLIEINTRDLTDRLTAEIINSGAVAFDQFEIQGRTHPAGAWLTLFSTTALFETPNGILLGASGDLTLLAGGVTGWFILNAVGFDSIRIQAARAAATLANVQVLTGGI